MILLLFGRVDWLARTLEASGVIDSSLEHCGDCAGVCCTHSAGIPNDNTCLGLHWHRAADRPPSRMSVPSLLESAVGRGKWFSLVGLGALSSSFTAFTLLHGWRQSDREDTPAKNTCPNCPWRFSFGDGTPGPERKPIRHKPTGTGY